MVQHSSPSIRVIKKITVVLLDIGQPWPLFVYFRPFLNTLTNIVQILTIGKHRWECLEFEPGTAEL